MSPNSKLIVDGVVGIVPDLGENSSESFAAASALAYYYDGNQPEIENDFQADRRWEETLVQERGEDRRGSNNRPVAKVVLVKRDRE